MQYRGINIGRVYKSNFFLSVQCNAQYWTEYKITLMRLFSAPEIFVPESRIQMYKARKTGRRQKMESIYGAGFRSVCHECNVSAQITIIYVVVESRTLRLSAAARLLYQPPTNAALVFNRSYMHCTQYDWLLA